MCNGISIMIHKNNLLSFHDRLLTIHIYLHERKVQFNDSYARFNGSYVLQASTCISRDGYDLNVYMNEVVYI